MTTRQVRWQHRKILEGRCMICGSIAEDRERCLHHLRVNRTAARDRYREKVGIPIGAPVRLGRPRTYR